MQHEHEQCGFDEVIDAYYGLSSRSGVLLTRRGVTKSGDERGSEALGETGERDPNNY